MAENIFFKLLEQSFPKTDKEAWKKTAVKELNGNEPFIDLKWKDNDRLEFYPYYEKEDIKNLHFQNSFNLPPSIDSFLGNRTWFNQPHVAVNNEVTANKVALEHLSNGADGIFFDVSQQRAHDLQKLFASIQWEYCVLSFKVKDNTFVENLSEYLKTSSINSTKNHGVIFHHSLPGQKTLAHSVLPSTLKSLGHYVNASTAVNEIHDALVFGVSVLDAADTPGAIVNQIAFSLNCDTHFLNQISKIKALRMLWYQVSQVYGIHSFKPEDLHIHIRSEAWINNGFQPHGNMLKATTAAMSGVIGGCNALTVFAEEENNTTMNRIARNVSSILREESHLDKVSDPLAGSYVVQVMADAIAQEAWKKFQKTMNSR